MAGQNNERETKDDVFDFIVRYKQNNDGNSPSMADIQNGCCIPSKSTVDIRLKELAEDGRILFGRFGRSRSIKVVGGKWSYG